MDTKPVETNQYSLPKQTRVPKKVLDKNDFLNLLVNQLKNQNPLEPQSNEQFITTMTQFNSMETLVSLDKNIEYGQAMAMIDKTVTVKPADKDPFSGKVEKAGIVDGKVMVTVGGSEYPMEEIKEILDQDSGHKPSAGTDLIQAALMIGREVLISKEDSTVRGLVEKVALDSGFIKVYVSGNPYDIDDITEIREAGEPEASTSITSQEP